MQTTPAIFVADSPGIDFLNSIAVPTDAAVEWLDSGEGLLRWLGESKLVETEILASFRASAVPGELDAVAAQARALREWFREFVMAHRGAPLDPAAIAQLEPLNRILARDEQYSQIMVRSGGEDGDGLPPARSGVKLERRRRWRSPDSLLLPIAEAMAQVISEDDFTYVKSCEGAHCTLMFVDRTRIRGRRWCSMSVCGNRAKQAAHRERISQGRH